MKTVECMSCGKKINAEDALHCEHCGAVYCPECAKRLAICECAGDLTYFN